jgi:hypothetical protein
MYILQWSHILPAIHTLSLLQGEFFPKWRTALHHWLCSGTADLGEVSDYTTVVIEHAVFCVPFVQLCNI